MAPRGGYSRNRAVGIEYVPVGETLDAEGKIMAKGMGQTFPVWIADAIEHHLYRCEMLLAQERYQFDQAEATRTYGISPMPYEAKYQVMRPKPTITREAGQGSGSAGKSYRP